MNTKLAKELIARAKKDQQARANYTGDIATWDPSVDKSNRVFLKKLIKKSGWPTITQVGSKASEAAWLLAQHADDDQKFQAYCLKLMEALPKGEIKPANLAYLQDRVLVAQGKPQIYGTQFWGDAKNADFREIVDIANIEKRRKSVGLGTFAAYKKKIYEDKWD